jgi:hypothetical protein
VVAGAVQSECGMRSSLLVLIAVVTLAAPAWATGERVIVADGAEAFRQNICVSMSCVSSGAREAIVTAHPVKGGVEVTVKNASGQVKLVHVTPRTTDGDLSSLDVVATSSLIVQAIESPKPLTSPTAKIARVPAKGSKSSKASKARLLARR